jgi:hypothetical protein
VIVVPSGCVTVNGYGVAVTAQRDTENAIAHRQKRILFM